MMVRQYLQVNYFGNHKLVTFRRNYSLPSLFILICLFLNVFAFTDINPAYAEPLIENSSKFNASSLAPVKIANSDKNSCASGALLGNRLITNYHVVASICPQSPCSNISLFNSENKLVSLNGARILRGASAAAYDLAILIIDSPNQKYFEAQFPKAIGMLETKSSRALRSLSFPSCKNLQQIDADKLSDIGKLYFNTSLKLKHGSSGGAIFDQNGNLSAIVSEANTFSDGLISMIFGTKFSETRAIPAQRVYELFDQDPIAIFDSQIENLLDFYLNKVSKTSGILRLEESSRFLSKVKNLALENLEISPASSALILAIDNYPYPLFVRNGWRFEELSPNAAKLALASSIEQYGLNSSANTLLNKEEIEALNKSLITKFESSAFAFSNIISNAKEFNLEGSALRIIKLFLPMLISLIVFIVLWLLGLGILIGTSRYYFIAKLIRVSALGLLAALVLPMLLWLTYPE